MKLIATIELYGDNKWTVLFFLLIAAFRGADGAGT
jgi:hypothetical protein